MCPTVRDTSASTLAPAPPSRSFKRSMKPRPARKVSASSRINLNKFWNELEEFYNRYDDRRARNHNMDLIGGCQLAASSLPAYTTDTYDHQREAAENELNERLEAGAKCNCCRRQQLPMPPHDLPATDDDVIVKRKLNYSLDSEVDSSFGSLTASDNDDSEDDEVFFTAAPVPRPPRTLLDLIQRMSFRD